MQGAASCQALLDGGESQVLQSQSFHLGFKTDPKAFLPGMSEEFSPGLTPLTCFIFLLCLPGFQLEAKSSARRGQPIPATSLTHMGGPKKEEESPRVFGLCWLEWA